MGDREALGGRELCLAGCAGQIDVERRRMSNRDHQKGDMHCDQPLEGV